MDPGGSEPDSSLSQTENPCLIVEDSQPDSAALEDDPDGSYRALLSRRLSSLQPTAHSPVLELISSPSVSRSPGAINHTLQTEARPSLEAQEHSQVVEVCSLGDAGRSTSKKMDSTTSAPTEEGMSQFGFLELSESQGIHDDLEKSGEKDEEEAETKNSTLDHLKPQVRTSQNPEDSQKMNIQTLLHSHAAGDGGDDLTSSQEDLFDGEQEDERPGEAEKRSLPTSTPAHSLHLLHLSGQGTLVQESLSQQSVEFVAATQERMSQTPLIVPNSPTGDELMDTSQPAGDQSLTNEEEPKGSKPEPPASTPVSQNSPGFVLDKSLSVPSQPEFSHDVFVATLSQEKPTEKSGTPASTDVAPGTAGVTLNTPRSGTSPEAEDTGSFQLELSTTTQPSICAVNTQAFLQDGDEDSQATQIEELESVPQNSGSRECARDGDALVTTARNVKQSLSSEGVVTAKHLNSGPAPTSPRAPHPASQSQSQSILSIYAAPKPQTEPTTQEEPSVTSDPQRGDQEVKEDVEEVVEETQKGCGVPPNTNTTCSPICLEESQRGSQQKSQATPTTQPPHGSAQAAGGSTRDGATVMPALGQGRRSLSHSQPEASSAKQAVEATPRSQSQGLSDSSGDTPFHFTLPKDGELMRPAVGSTPPLVSHLKKTPRHSTPIEKSPFSEQLEGDVTPGTTMADSDLMVAEESGREPAAGNSGKLSLRMKLVTPVEEVSSGSEHFSLQKPSLSDEEGSVSTATTAAKVVSSPTVFSRVREVHRRVDGAEDVQPAAPSSPFSGGSFNSPIHGDGDSERKSRPHPQPSSRPAPRPAPSEPITSTPQQELMGNGPGPAEETGPPKTPPRNRAVSQQTSCEAPGSSSSSSKLRQRAVSQQTSFDAPGPNKSGWAPAGTCVRRVVRTVQEVRTTVTRTVTEVYYEDGREVERRVSEESDEPVVECRVLDQDVSPSRTGSSLTSGDLADVSSLSSKASSLAHSSSGGGGTAPVARHPDFIVPTSRGAAKSASPRRGGRQQQTPLSVGSREPKAQVSQPPLTPATPRGRSRRGRPPSRSPPSRGGRAAAVQAASSSEDEPFTRICSRTPGQGDSPDAAGGAGGSSLVGLRVVAKWSSNGYFYSGCITRDLGEGRFRLRFDDGYECEVQGRDILLCDPIPVETEVTALSEDEYFNTGLVKAHRTAGGELHYCVEKDGQQKWYRRPSVLLSLEQGVRLRDQYGLGPYEPPAPLAKASDISLDNLVEGKRRRRNNAGDAVSSSSPRTPGPSGKRKLTAAKEEHSPAKRGRKSGHPGAGRRAAGCNTSGSGTELPSDPGDLVGTHGPLPESSSLFMGFAFLLTVSSERDRLVNWAGSDSEEDFVEAAPYNRSYTVTQLEAGGGCVLPDFNEEQCKAAYQSLLIADQHCRTRKYLLCVAGGVPCVSHMWVKDCCQEQKLLNYRNYLLPAGVGPDQRIVEWHPRSSPFQALRVLLVLPDPADLWVELLKLSGAAGVEQHKPNGDNNYALGDTLDVIVTDRSCPPPLVSHASSVSLPVVSLEWLIDSLIVGERQDYVSKPGYRHDNDP